MPELRRARDIDVSQINEIYNHYVTDTAITFDVELSSLAARLEWFEQFRDRGRYQIFVACDGDRVLGYACSRRFREKTAYETSVETTIYLSPDARGRGLGRRLYQTLFAALEPEDVHRAYAGITLPNPASVALHLRLGFRPIGRFREVGRKLGRYWDVEWYERELEVSI